jgi:hypothetical protein
MVGLRPAHARDVPLRNAQITDFPDFESGQRQALGQKFNGDVNVYEFFEPGYGYEHSALNVDLFPAFTYLG